MSDFDIKRAQGNTKDPLVINCLKRDADGNLSAVDLTGEDVYLYIRPKNSDTNLSEFNPADVTTSIPTPDNGQISHTLTALQVAQLVAGRYTMQIKTDDGAGGIRFIPDDVLGGVSKDTLELLITGTLAT